MPRVRPKRDPSDPLRAITAAIILNAVQVYRESLNTWQRLDAICWLAGDDFPMFADVAGLQTQNGLQFLQVSNGRTRTTRSRSAGTVARPRAKHYTIEGDQKDNG